LYSFGIQSTYPAALGIKASFSALTCTDIPHFLQASLSIADAKVMLFSELTKFSALFL
jgi:hypothetical protein